jgi:hypothetical protein
MLRKKSEMTGEGTNAMADENREKHLQESARTLTDSHIVTKRKLPTRKFFTAAGMVLATGALAVAAGAQATPQTPDPDKTKSNSAGAPTQKAPDPDKKKAADPDKKKATGAKSSDAQKAKKKAPEKPSDPDAPKK